MIKYRDEIIIIILAMMLALLIGILAVFNDSKEDQVIVNVEIDNPQIPLQPPIIKDINIDYDIDIDIDGGFIPPGHLKWKRR